MAKRPDPPMLQRREFRSPGEIDLAIRQLTRRIDDLKSLDVVSAVKNESGAIEVATSDVKEAIREAFGPNSPEMREHQYIRLWAGPLFINMSNGAIVNATEAGRKQVIEILNGLIRRLNEKREDMGGQMTTVGKVSDSRKIFLVHGHDQAVTSIVARFLEKLKLEAVILHEQPNEGQTIIEKFERHADVGFAVVLLTPDDMGGIAPGSNLQPRARQNVILELGYFIGKLGRPRVCALYVTGVELPSDLHGLVWVAYDSGAWQTKLANEMRATGISIDMNLI
jgi:predicted nucleotide-binding protein